ncbi:MAG: YlxM family DNA-binding protein [Bacillota bacterium]
MEKRVRIGCLFDFYAELLTERQQAILDEHYNQDLSLSEIAHRLSISRQAVLDTLRRGEAQLEHWEEKLGIYALYSKNTKALDKCLELLEGIGQNDENTGAVQALQKELKAMRDGWEEANGI